MARLADDVDALFGELCRIGERPAELRRCLEAHALEDDVLRALLRRAVPIRLLEIVAAHPPWCERPRVLAAVVLNPRAPRTLGLRAVESLFWRDQAQVAATVRVNAAVRARAEALLVEQTPRLGLGSRLSLAHLATGPVLALLLRDQDPRVVRAALQAPRLTERELLRALRTRPLARHLAEETLLSQRWRSCYAARLEVVLNPQTPLPVSLSQLTSLRAADLRRVVETAELPPLVHRAALRVLSESSGRPGHC